MQSLENCEFCIHCKDYVKPGFGDNFDIKRNKIIVLNGRGWHPSLALCVSKYGKKIMKNCKWCPAFKEQKFNKNVNWEGIFNEVK